VALNASASIATQPCRDPKKNDTKLVTSIDSSTFKDQHKQQR